MVWETERQDSWPWDIHIPVKGKEGSSNLVKLLLGAKFHMRYFTKSLSDTQETDVSKNMPGPGISV